MSGEARTLSVPTKFAFGMGQAAEGIKNSAFNIFVLFYYNQVLGLSGTYTGLALGIAIVFDAITDPLAGSLSDRARTRWGRRHPFMFASAFPLAFTFFMLFAPPEGLGQVALFGWLTTFAVLVRGSMTAYHIPHLALGAEIAADYNDRSSVFAYSTLLGWAGGITCGFVAYTVFFPSVPEFENGLLNPAGYPPFAAWFGGAMVLTILYCCWGTRKEIPYLPVPLEPPPPFSVGAIVRELASVFRSRSFLAIFFGLLMGALVLSIEGVFSAYMGVHFWGLPTEMIRFIPLGAAVGLIVAFILTPLFTRWFDKRNAIVICAVVAIVNANIPVCLRLLGVSWFPENGDPLLVPILIGSAFIGGSFAPVIFTTINSVFADICDEFELDTGRRVEGIVYATRAFALKAATGLGSMIGGIVLDLIRFPSNALPGAVDPDVIFRLGVAQGPATSVFTLLSLLFYFQYKLDRKKHAKIVEALAERRAEAPPAAATGGS
ncbi:MAG: MFS transporter [Deltaproteobacteria bacterium]|nr:MFS transporter [Deltaproteobacteria bacterium]